jgi:hypothetical protein
MMPSEGMLDLARHWSVSQVDRHARPILKHVL